MVADARVRARDRPGFDAGSRAENARRAGEAARMVADAGLVVLAYVEVYVDTPLEVCEQRDPRVCTGGRVPARCTASPASTIRTSRRPTPTWSSTARVR